MKFTKMHGIGNDYVYVNCFEEEVKDPSKTAKFVSDRHFGIGSDGLILIKPSTIADCEMDMYNMDGSQGAMCGNGVRCVAQYLYEHGLPRDVLEIDTRMAGRKTLRRLGEGMWQADMGRFDASADALPAVGLGPGPLVHAELIAAGRAWDVACISMGNPHCVIVWDSPDPLPEGPATRIFSPG